MFALAHGEGGWTPTRLLLTGIVMAAGASAVVSMLLALGNETELARNAVLADGRSVDEHPTLAAA